MKPYIESYLMNLLLPTPTITTNTNKPPKQPNSPTASNLKPFLVPALPARTNNRIENDLQDLFSSRDRNQQIGDELKPKYSESPVKSEELRNHIHPRPQEYQKLSQPPIRRPDHLRRSNVYNRDKEQQRFGRQNLGREIYWHRSYGK